MKKQNFIRNLSNCGVGLFLITGLYGCNNARQEMCKNVSKLSKNQLEECTNNQSSSSSFVFVSNSSSSAKSSGYFSSSSGSLDSGG